MAVSLALGGESYVVGVGVLSGREAEFWLGFQVQAWARQHLQRLGGALNELLATLDLLESLLGWLQWAETTLNQKDKDTLPQEIEEVKALIAEHQVRDAECFFTECESWTEVFSCISAACSINGYLSSQTLKPSRSPLPLPSIASCLDLHGGNDQEAA